MSGIVSPLEFRTPGLEDFKFDGTFGVAWMDKPFWQAVIAFLVVIAFWVWMSRGLKVMPGKRQVFGEYCYNFIRNSLVRDTIGHGFEPWLPYLVALFSFMRRPRRGLPDHRNTAHYCPARVPSGTV